MPTTRVRGYCASREEPVVRQSRRCSRSGCAQPAAGALTYVYGPAAPAGGPGARVSAPAREDPVVRQPRRCSRSGCAQPAAATLTYVYAESTAVVGPLATFSEPHSYDLCEFHGERLTVPRGWEVVRHEIDIEDSGPTGDDLLAPDRRSGS